MGGHMASYDAVVTLMRDLELLLSSFIRDQEENDLLKYETEALYKQVRLMDSLLTNSSQSYDPKLVDRIVGVAREAENYVFSEISNVALLGIGDAVTITTVPTECEFWNKILHQTTADVHRLDVQMKGDGDVDRRASKKLNEAASVGTGVRPSSEKGGKFIGLEEEVQELLHCLTRQPLALQIIAITGRAGIGKTTVTERVYDHPDVASHFDICLWINISDQQSLKQVPDVLMGIFQRDQEQRSSNYSRRFLRDKRYLIVLDDMYTGSYWHDLENYFPNDNNGSRIIVTSRLQCASPKIKLHYLRCLSSHESWELLNSKIFLNETCPRELVHLGEQIANQCQGLPLALVLVGEILYKMNKTSTVWEEVVQRLGSLMTADHPQSPSILGFSYSHLLDHFKACLFHMGVSPQNYRIRTERKFLGLSHGMPLTRTAEVSNDTELKTNHDSRQVLDNAGQDLEDTTSTAVGCIVLPFSVQLEDRLILNSRELGSNSFPRQGVMLAGHASKCVFILSDLTSLALRLKVSAITGVCGIGKTTLMRRLYEDPLVGSHFDVRAWVTLSQQNQLKEDFMGLLSCIRDVTDAHDSSLKELRSEFCGFLKGKRYLIVLDNMWHRDVWAFWEKIFQDDKNGSRVILTTPLFNVSTGIDHQHLDCISRSETWKLLCSKIFLSESCPIELVSARNIIAYKCLPLPLVITVIGELLSKVEKTKTVWEKVANSLTMVIDPRGWKYKLYVRNSHLLDRLKMCFFNMGVFPEDQMVRTQRKFFDESPKITFKQIAKEMSKINKELGRIHNHGVVRESEVDRNVDTSSTTGSGNRTNYKRSRSSTKISEKLVGLGEELVEILDCLTGQPSHLKVIAFTGMAGIGKTTFTRRLYDDPLVVPHFYVRSWVTLSQHYDLKKVLLGLLSCNTNLSDEMYEWSHNELAERLYRGLKGQRYLVVLDDMWEPKIWDDLRRAFPDDDNGSRIILTSRLRDVCIHASQDTQPHSLRCLSPSESWELLCSKIFPNESCPLELVPLGKQIVDKCQGLPLGIIVVGGLLFEMDKTLTTWGKVAKRVGSLVMEDPRRCQNILALSYNHLTDSSKACFLYMGIFPEDYEIPCKKLIYLWMAEGLIPASRVRSLEEEAESYLEDLIARSLVMVKRRSSSGRVRLCYIHDLMRDFCVREAQKDNFLHVINNIRQEHRTDLVNLRRVAFHSSIRNYMSTEAPILFTRCRSFICFDVLGPTDVKGCSGMYFKFIRVLDISQIHLFNIPVELSSLNHLRYLAITVRNSVYISVLLKLINLQTLIAICDWDGHLSEELWKMFELRHFYLKGSCVSSSLVHRVLTDNYGLTILRNLQTLSTIRPNSCTKEVFMSFPNLKKLGIFETEDDHQFNGWFKNLVYLQALETLKYIFSNPFVTPSFRERHPSWGVFPPKLMKLTLGGTLLPWEEMAQLSSLPNLEVLKLKNYAFTGPIWSPTEDGFKCLKFLFIGSTDLQLWEADFCPYPRLQHLVLRHCRLLKDIPSGLGEASLLEKIELHGCGDSAADSARKLQEEQKDYGNESLTVYVTKGRGYRSF